VVPSSRRIYQPLTIKNLIALGGIIHTIDRVLEVPIGPIQTFSAENLTYFLAITAKGGFLSTDSRPLIDAFFSKTDVTYLISNSAKALANVNFTNLDQSVIKQLINYIAIPQLVYSTGLANGAHLMTAAGVPVLVTVQDGDTYINAAKVTSADNFISNGVFHIIDE
jgi:uncharacterized surface protein with fasciclin (FAS1) repeats